jgi:copper transport protein
VKCELVREALSARYDGEPARQDAATVRAHVAGCPACAAFERSLGAIDRAVRAGAPRPPAYLPLVLHPLRRRALRLGVAGLAVLELVLAVLAMFEEHDHESHESSSFTLALCVALLYAALRPVLARGYVPVLAVASVLLVATSVTDVDEGRIALAHEWPHLGLVLGTVLLWLLSLDESGTPPAWLSWLRRPRPVHPRPGLRVVGRTAAAMAMAASFVLLAGPASAHAVLEQSTPRPDSVLTTAPTEVTLRYDEPVTLLADSLRVYGPDGKRADRGDVGHPTGHGDEVRVSLGAAAQGTYLVSWRVISADSHPVSGAFTYSVGKRTAAPTAPAENADQGMGGLLGVARWIGYAGSALLVGVLLVVAWCWREGWGNRDVRRLLGTGVGLLGVGAVLDFFLKGPYDAALGLGAIAHGDLIREVLGTTYGHATLARFVLAGLGVGLMALRRPSRLLASCYAVLVGISFALAGHAAAGSGRVLATINDTVHVLAASTWLGGLVLLLAVVLRPAPAAVDVTDVRAPATSPAAAGAAEPAEPAELAPVVRRFSRLAAVLVLLLVATGIYQAARQVGSWGAFGATTYGRELLVKIGVICVVVLLAAGSRAFVWRGGHPSRLRRTVLGEALGLAVVLGITSALVATEPAKTAYHPTASANLSIAGDTVQVSVVPAGDRQMQLHLYLFGADQQPTDPKEVDASVSLPAKSIGPLPVALSVAGPGHRTGTIAVPMTGSWQLAVTVRTTAVDEATGYLTMSIR